MIDGVLVGDWLIEKIGNKKFHTPFDVFRFILKRLPEDLTNNDSNNSIKFLCGMYVDNSPMIVGMTTFDKIIKTDSVSAGNASWDGSGKELAANIFNCDLGIQWNKLNATEMLNLFKLVGNTVIDIAKISKNQTIGGEILTEILQRPNPDLLK